jgi:chromosome segregation ATPase
MTDIETDDTDELRAEIERLNERLAVVETENSRKDDEIERLNERLAVVESESSRKDDEIERLSRDLASERGRVTELESEVETLRSESDASDENDESDDGRSPLAQLIDVPLERAKKQLTANQVRARTVAQRAIELGKKTQAGIVLKSEDIASYLEERSINPHTETIRRVMDYLDDLGKNDVEDTIHKGDRLLVFDPERVQEYGTGEPPERVSSQRDVIRLRESESPPPAA